jgi:uncharacterized protein YcbK (DUF882 family)
MVPYDEIRNAANTPLSRRRLLLWAAAGTMTVALPGRGLASVLSPGLRERTLSFFNTHTEERLKVVYRAGGRYIPRALKAINRILRDHRTGEVIGIDSELLDLLYVLRKKLGTGEPFHVISGYRSFRTNEMLRSRGHGVVRNSLHLVGKAVDIYLPDCDLTALRDAAVEEQAGGVGYYPGPHFVHVDVGRVRTW